MAMASHGRRASLFSFARQWCFWRVNARGRRAPTAQVGFFVLGISVLCQCTAFDIPTPLMSMMAMASQGRRVSLLSCCLGGEVEKLRSKGSRRATKDEQRVERSTRTHVHRASAPLPDGDQTLTRVRVNPIDEQTRCHPQTSACCLLDGPHRRVFPKSLVLLAMTVCSDQIKGCAKKQGAT